MQMRVLHPYLKIIENFVISNRYQVYIDYISILYNKISRDFRGIKRVNLLTLFLWISNLEPVKQRLRAF